MLCLNIEIIAMEYDTWNIEYLKWNMQMWRNYS